MRNKLLFNNVLLAASVSLSVQQSATITLHADQGKQIIPKEIYGQFAEHLGTCIYGGLWVGENSDIPNVKGYRTDVFNALKNLQVPVLRWSGGCFADEYHWMDGIGSKGNHPKMVNSNQGGTIEDNSFDTHKFLDLCEMLGCEPYINGNVGSGTIEELAKWVEYMTSDNNSPMANLHRKDGRDRVWKARYLGVSSEGWGCGGSMRPEYYADLYRRYSTYCRNYDNNRLFKIASGASDYDYEWTKVLVERVSSRTNGLSFHYYTVSGWAGSKGSVTRFDKDDYCWTIGKCREIEDVIRRHCAIMDEYDKGKNVALMLDEWGTWWNEESGTVRGRLYQQNTMHDTFVASLSLDVFHRYTDHLKMANIAQVVNVLQSMILTKGKEMALTPTYYVFKMYKVHQGATYLPIEISCQQMNVRDKRILLLISATVSKNKGGKIRISLSNVDVDNEQEVIVSLPGIQATKAVGEMLTSVQVTDYNSFENPDKVKLVSFKEVKINKRVLKIKLPAKSIVTVELQ